MNKTDTMSPPWSLRPSGMCAGGADTHRCEPFMQAVGGGSTENVWNVWGLVGESREEGEEREERVPSHRESLCRGSWDGQGQSIGGRAPRGQLRVDLGPMSRRMDFIWRVWGNSKSLQLGGDMTGFSLSRGPPSCCVGVSQRGQAWRRRRPSRRGSGSGLRKRQWRWREVGGSERRKEVQRWRGEQLGIIPTSDMGT